MTPPRKRFCIFRPFKAFGRLVRFLTTTADNTTPSAIRIWGLGFATIDIGMSGSHLVLVWLSAFGRVAPGFDVMGAAQGFSMIMAAQWVGLAAFAASLKWKAGEESDGVAFGPPWPFGVGGKTW